MFRSRTPAPPTAEQELLGRWLQWVASAAPQDCPVADENGRCGAARQGDDVWFLAGTFGGPVERRLAVPAGVPLHVPVFVTWLAGWGLRPSLPRNAFAGLLVDDEPTAVQPVRLDRRVAVTGTPDNPVTGSGDTVRVGAVALSATVRLAPGRHEVVLHGGDGAGFEVGVVHHLDVG